MAKKRPPRFTVHEGAGPRPLSGNVLAKRIANTLGGQPPPSDRRAFSYEVMEAAGVLAGLADAATDAGWKDAEALLEEARQKLFDLVEVLGGNA
jgi:hypothetical protein